MNVAYMCFKTDEAIMDALMYRAEKTGRGGGEKYPHRASPGGIAVGHFLR